MGGKQMSDTLDFSGTMSMVKTDNGWQEARQRLARAPDIGAMMIAIIFNLVRFREQSRDLLFFVQAWPHLLGGESLLLARQGQELAI